MKTNFLLLICTIALLASCTTAYKNGQTPDDVYYSPQPKLDSIDDDNNDSVQVKRSKRNYTRNYDDRSYDRNYNTGYRPTVVIINPTPAKPKAISKTTTTGNSGTNNDNVDRNPKSNPKPKESGIIRLFKAIAGSGNNNNNSGSNNNTPSSKGSGGSSSSGSSGGGSAPVRTFKGGGN